MWSVSSVHIYNLMYYYFFIYVVMIVFGGNTKYCIGNTLRSSKCGYVPLWIYSFQPSVSSIAEFVPGSGGSAGLAHSASTPSFHSFTGLGSPSTPSSLSFTPMTGTSPAATVASPQRPVSPQGSPNRGRHSPLVGGGDDTSNASSLSTYQENVGGTTYFFTAQDQQSFTAGAAPSPAPFTAGPPPLVFPPYHILPPTPAHIHHLRAPSNTPHFFMGDELRHDLLERHALALAHVDPENFPGNW